MLALLSNILAIKGAICKSNILLSNLRTSAHPEKQQSPLHAWLAATDQRHNNQEEVYILSW